LGKAAVARAPEIEGRNSLDIADDRVGAAKPAQADLRPAFAEHEDPPPHGRVRQVMNQIENVQHQNAIACSRPPTR
jgi:hypothetical protein